MPGSPSPTVARARATVAAISRCVNNGERSADELENAYRDLEFAKVADYIQKTVAVAPPFTPEQVDRLRVLLEPARRDLAALEPFGGGDHAA
jgi:hypothetical protein